MTESIFSFGTLRSEAVQRSVFGELMPSKPDSLAGWVIAPVPILDPTVIAISGTDSHPGLVPTGNQTDVVNGSVLDVTTDQLAAADDYERASFHRIEVTLVSGKSAWTYVPK